MGTLPENMMLSIPSWSTEERRRAETWAWPDQGDDVEHSSPAATSEESTIAWGISKIKDNLISFNGTGVDIIRADRGQLEWHPGVHDSAIIGLLQITQAIAGSNTITICFVNTLPSIGGKVACNFSSRTSTIIALKAAGLSSSLLSNMFTETSYWAKMGNHQSIIRNSAGDVDTLELCYQYRTGWRRPEKISYTHVRHDNTGATYFCVNYPPKAFAILKRMLQSGGTSDLELSHVDSLAAADNLSQWQCDLGSLRKRMIIKERLYNSPMTDIDFSTETRELHQLSKEFLALREDLVAFHTQLKYLQNAFELLPLPHNQTTRITTNNTTNPFDVLISQAEICSRWPIVYGERINICIQLLFHFSNQKIAASSHTIAEQTQRDSASMITIAAVTMVFLPGTFISAILSTTFFDFGQQTLQVSNKWWISLVTTVPLTVVVFGFWYWWRWKGFPRRNEVKRFLDGGRRNGGKNGGV